MKRSFRIIVRILLAIMVVWTLLTLWAEGSNKNIYESFGKENALYKAVILFKPDPFYNLDEQLSNTIAEELVENGFEVKLFSISAYQKQPVTDLFIICANTYNWAPDWKTISFIKEHAELENSDVAALTLGAGATARSSRLLEKALNDRHARLIDSKEFWLLKPNDEQRMDEPNVEVARELADKWTYEVAQKITNEYSRIN
ncbi:MAG: hypothetical protein P8X57_08705 [Cyclobacteriaceae bacterium]